jgi:aminopeptidase N
MENATAIFYADRSFRTRTLRVGTIAHETMHQWFGDAVTESRFAELWLSEGFATYGEQLWVQHADGDSAFRAGMRALRDEITSSRTSAMRPVIDTTEADYLALLNTNSYQKGAWVLHMLRARMGDSAFFRGLRAYYAAHRNGNARTADLERAMEDASGERLDWFFEQWLRRPGWAEITTHWRYDPRARRVTLYVEQGPRFAPARFPLTVELIDADGKTRRATVDVAPMLRQRIVIPLGLDEPPRSLILDPDVVLLGTFR